MEIITVNGINYLFVKESVLVEFFNTGTASSPQKVGSTSNLTGACGANLEVVGTYAAGKSDNAIFVSKKCGDILSYDLSNMPNARETASIPGVSVDAMAVYRTTTKRYLLVGGNGIKYADYSSMGSSSDTRSLTTLISGVMPTSIRVTGNYLVVGTASSANIYNISGMPSYSTVAACSGYSPFDVYYDQSSGLMYVADGDGYLKIVNPSSCQTLGEVYLPTSSVSFIDLRDDLLFIALGTYIQSTGQGGFRIVDVSNPAVPVDVTGNGSDFFTGEAAIAVHPSANYFYVSSGSPIVYSFTNCSAVQGPNIDMYGTPVVSDDHPTGGPACATNPDQGPFSCDGNIDSGEVFKLKIDVKNTGTASASTVTGTLAYNGIDGSVTVTTPTASYGTIAAGATATQSQLYVLEVSPTANTTSSPITKNFTLTVKDATNTTWDLGFTLTIQGSRAVLQRTVNHTAGQVTVQYENVGTLASSSFTLGLESSTQGITYESTVRSVPSLAANGGLSSVLPYTYTNSSTCGSLNYLATHFITSPATIDPNPPYAGVPIGSYSGAMPYVVEQNSSAFSKAKTTGTTYNVFFTLANKGTDSASNVTATLSVDRTDIISLSDNTASFGTIFAGGTKTNSGTDPFVLDLSDTATGSAVFTLTITSDQGCFEAVFAEADMATWLQDLNLDYIGWKAYGCGTTPLPGAPAHPDLYEGNCYTFKFTLQNDGSSPATNLEATVTSSNAKAIVLNSVDYYNIGANGDQAENLSGFSVDLADDYCTGTTCPSLTLTLNVPDAGFSQNQPLTIHDSSTTTNDPILVYQSNTITSDNNSNGQANPGETVYFKITVKNSGTGNATNVQASITSSSGDATVNTGQISMGTINAGATATSTSTFKVTFSSGITGNQTFTFPLTLAATEGNWSGSVKITVIDPSAAPAFSYVGYSFCDDTYGNGDGVWNPGERVPLAVRVHNGGTTAAVNVVMTLATALSGVTIQDDTITVSRIMPNADADAIFLVDLASGVSSTSLPFTITSNDPAFSQGFTVNTTIDNNDNCGSGGSTGSPTANFAWIPSEPKTGETVYFTDQSSGGPTSWSWNFGDGGISAIQNPNHVFSAPGSYQVNLTVANESGSNSLTKTVVVSQSGTIPSNKSYVLPVVARFHGNYDSFWVSDVFLHNPNSNSDLIINFRYSYIFANEGHTVESPFSLTLNPMQTIIIEDVLTLQFPTSGLPEDISGMLIVDFSGSASLPPLVAGRIYNKQADGTFGQYIPAISLLNPIRDYTDDVILYALEQNAAFRTQLGTTNLSSEPNTVTYTVYDSSGRDVKQFQRTIGGLSNDQVSLYAYITDEGPFTVKIHSESVLPFTSYASVSDKITSDAVFQPDVRDSDETLFLPGVTHAAGSFGSNWRTDLYMHNPTPAQMVIATLLYPNSETTPQGFTATKNYTLNAGETIVIHDVVTDILPDLTDDFVGYIIFKKILGSEDENPFIGSRTYNLSPEGGTFGQYIPALSQGADFGAGQILYLTGLRQDDEWRTNIGFVNVSSTTPLVMNLTLYDPEGNPVRISQGYTVDPLSARQAKLTDIFGEIDVLAGTVRVEVTSGQGGYLYASVVDNGVNDGIFITALKEPPKVN